MRRTRPDAPPGAPRHLLVRLPGPMGDAVLATPALRALRRALPATRITWAGPPAVLAALEGLPWRDGVTPVAGPMARGALAPWRLGRLWRHVGPDAVLLLSHSFSSALAARLSGAGVRVGSVLHGRSLLLTHRVDLPRRGAGLLPRPMTRMYLDLVAAFGAVDDGGPAEVVVRPADAERAERCLDRAFGPAWRAARLLAVNPGARFGPSKVYPPGRLGEAVALVREAAGVLPVMLCGPGEEDLARTASRAAGPPVLSLDGDPPGVGALKGILARASLLLTTDAGPRHLAEALGTPTVVILGPTDPVWGAGGDATLVRQEHLPCLGCHLRRCPIGHPCMETLTPERVAAACRAVLGRRGLLEEASAARAPDGGG